MRNAAAAVAAGACAALLLAPGASAAVPVHVDTFDYSSVSPTPPKEIDPTAIAVDEATGDVYVWDKNDSGLGNNMIMRFSESGQHLSSISGLETARESFGNFQPGFDQLAIDNSGTATQGQIYAIGLAATRLFAFDAQHGFSWETAENLLSGCGVGVDPLGQLWTLDAVNGMQRRDLDAAGAATGPTFGGGNHCQLAFDPGDGDAYLMNTFNSGEAENVTSLAAPAYTASSTAVTVPRFASSVAVDSTTGNLYVGLLDGGSKNPAQIHIFDPAGGEVEGSPFEVSGGRFKVLAVDGSRGRVYALLEKEFGVRVFEYEGATPKPTARTEAATELDFASAQLNGRANPRGAATTCSFEYVEEAQFQLDEFESAQQAPCESAPGEGEAEVGVTASPEGLQGGTAYRYRLVSESANGLTNGATYEFRTLAVEHELSVAVSGIGSVSADSGAIAACTEADGVCVGDYEEGSTVLLSAMPGASQQLQSWSGCDAEPEGKCEVTIGEGDAEVSAAFAPIIHSLTVSTTGSGSGSVSCDGGACLSEYEQGTALTLTASAAGGSSFTGWSGGCSGTGSCALTIAADTAVSAAFAADPPSDDGGGDGGGESQPILAPPPLAKPKPKFTYGKCIRRAKAIHRRGLRQARAKRGRARVRALRQARRKRARVVIACKRRFGKPLPKKARRNARGVEAR
jgi:DNA-binding beta-propeller fold protein YncE